MEETKICTKCGIEKSLSDFYIEKRSGKEYPDCKQCRKDAARSYREGLDSGVLEDRRLRNVYGITLEEYDELWSKQGGVCRTCGGINKDGRRLSVDHDHDTDKVRGLLCTSCNLALGHIKDSVEILESMIKYLEGNDGD